MIKAPIKFTGTARANIPKGEVCVGWQRWSNEYLLRVKVATILDRTHNPFEETHWLSGLRENLTSRSDGEGLETGLRSTLKRARRGKPRIQPRVILRVTAPVLYPTNRFR
jgi:hypothetical protein